MVKPLDNSMPLDLMFISDNAVLRPQYIHLIPVVEKGCWEICMWPTRVSSEPEARFTLISMFSEAGNDLTSVGQ